VLLVEGDSDLIFLKGLSPVNNSYCFDKQIFQLLELMEK
jgi:hypothetical protein